MPTFSTFCFVLRTDTYWEFGQTRIFSHFQPFSAFLLFTTDLTFTQEPLSDSEEDDWMDDSEEDDSEEEETEKSNFIELLRDFGFKTLNLNKATNLEGTHPYDHIVVPINGFEKTSEFSVFPLFEEIYNQKAKAPGTSDLILPKRLRDVLHKYDGQPLDKVGKKACQEVNKAREAVRKAISDHRPVCWPYTEFIHNKTAVRTSGDTSGDY